MALNTVLNVGITGTLTGTAVLGITPQYPFALPSFIADTLATGTGANQATRLYVDSRTLATTVSEDIDMYDFAGATDQVGAVFALSAVKILMIKNTATAANEYLSVGNKATSAGWISPFGANTHLIKIRPGGTLVMYAPDVTGFAVVDATNHLLKVLNSGAGSITYQIIVVGV